MQDGDVVFVKSVIQSETVLHKKFWFQISIKKILLVNVCAV